MKTLFRIVSLVFVFFLLLFISCFQTKTLVSEPSVTLNNIRNPLYCGTYSSFIYYDKNKRVRFNDSLTRLGNALYDSIIRHRIKKLVFTKESFVKDSSEAQALSQEIMGLISYAVKSQSIKNYPLSDIFYKLTQNYSNNDFIFFVPTGYIRSPANFKESIQQQHDQLGPNLEMASIVGSLLATALTGNLLYYIFIPKDNGVHAYGSNCHILVYNKSKNEISLYRQQFFTRDNVLPLERKYLKKQVDYLLKEFL